MSVVGGQPKKHANPSYKATKHIDRTFQIGDYFSLLYGKLRERAVCGEFCVLIGYPSGQDGAILPARDCPFRSRK